MHPDYKYIHALHNNDNSLVGEIYQKFYPAAERFVKSKGGTAQDAEDAFQEALIAIYKYAKKPDFKLSTTFEKFLLGFVRIIFLNNRGITFDISQAKRDKILAALNDTKDADRIQAFSMLVWKHLNIIGQPCGRILLLKFNKASMKEIAEIFGIPNESAAAAKRYRCYKKFKRSLFNDPDFRQLFNL